MFLFLYYIFGYNINKIVNKKILIRSIPYDNYIIAEDISDFSPNVFHTKNILHDLQGFNKISMLEQQDNKYKIKIGNYYLCHDPTVVCNFTDGKCTDNEYKQIDCDVCRNKFIKVCNNDPELWEIERTFFGFNIRQKNKCLTLGYKLLLSECNGHKNQIFGFEDYELMSCFENFNFDKKPTTRKEEIKLAKMKKLLKQVEKKNPEKVKKILNDKKTEDEVLEKLVPGIKDKPKMKKMWGSLWNYSFKGISLPNGYKFKMFCTKWW
ncbi:polar tube protein 5 (PTP5) [Vairimorpha necatrix]|uniref:Polar tube protein 5 (PTP5) n=1 Tax=Vairimorpha necatrix TaxID=6039 RepID=A0AAX4JF34_9MICR